MRSFNAVTLVLGFMLVHLLDVSELYTGQVLGTQSVGGCNY